MPVELAWQWFEPRIKAGTIKYYTLDLSKYGTEWPAGLMHKAIVLMKQKQLAVPSTTVGKSLFDLSVLLYFSPKCMPHLLDSLTADEWQEFKSTLEADTATKNVLSLLLSNHSLLDQYHSEPRAGSST